MQVERLHNLTVDPVIRKQEDIEKIAGHKLFQKLEANIAICGTTNSGKTNCLYTILKNCAGKKTNIILFASAVNCDATYDEIITMLEKKGCNVSTFDSLYEQEEDEDTGQVTGKPFNILNGIRRELQKGKDKEESKIEVPTRDPCPKLFFGMPTRKDILREERKIEKELKKEDTKEKKEKKKKQYPELIVVTDDLGSENRDKSINKMWIKSRHFKSKCISLVHTPKNLEPSSIQQLSYILIFGGFTEADIQHLYDKIGFKLSFDKFMKAYRFATEEKYHFFYIDRPRTELRKDFNQLITFTESDSESEESD